MGFTLFFLIYGVEAVLPTDLEYESPKLKGYEENSNQRAHEDSLDQIDEACDVAMCTRQDTSRHSGDTRLRKFSAETSVRAT
jgi:aspartate carbamoyltransferase catalytic subunit